MAVFTKTVVSGAVASKPNTSCKAVTQAKEVGEGAGRRADPSFAGRRNGLAEPSDKVLGKVRNQESCKNLFMREVGLLVTDLGLKHGSCVPRATKSEPHLGTSR